MRKLTVEQKAKSAERKARFSALVKQVAEMSDEQRAEMAARMSAVVNCDGRSLSPRNTMLVAMQRAGVTIVGGFRQWIEKGRCVRKGEHGMSILVPCSPRKDENRQEGEISTRDRVYFVGGTVFDISQTDAVLDANEESAPEPARPLLLAGERQGDLISSTQTEDFALATQSAIDGEAVTAAKAEREDNERATVAQNLTFELEAA